MDKIIFADNSEYKCGFCGEANVGILFVTLSDVSFVEAAVIFNDEKKTSKIRYVGADGVETVFEYYTKFEYLVNEANGIRGALRQKYASEVTANE